MSDPKDRQIERLRKEMQGAFCGLVVLLMLLFIVYVVGRLTEGERHKEIIMRLERIESNLSKHSALSGWDENFQHLSIEGEKQ